MIKKFSLLTLSLLLLTSCGNITATSTTGAADELDYSSSGIWTAEIDQDSDGEEVGVSCEDLTGALEGEKVRCYVHFLATNTSNLPQQYSGYYYLEANGVTYLSENSYQNSIAINPGDYLRRQIAFSIPYLSNVTNLYLAEGPTSAHAFDLPLNVNIRR